MIGQVEPVNPRTLFDWDAQRTQVFSYGGGVNSVAIAVLIARGDLPRPDIIVMADTGREATSTWNYLDEVMQPYLARIGLRVEIAPHDLATVDLYAHNGDLLLPMYTTWVSKKNKNLFAKLPTYCSSEWKMLVGRRYLRQHGVKSCDLWLGYSIDEARRAQQSKLKWENRTFPLLDMMLSRRDCLDIIASEGLPEPAHSSCWMCPHRDNFEWRFLRDKYPDDFKNAIRLEKQVREKDEHIWLHQDCVPLEDANLEIDNSATIAQCGLGACFI